MKLSHVRVPAAIALTASLAGTVTTPVFAFERVVETTNNYTYTCGPVTCSIYYTRGQTQRIRDTLNRYHSAINASIGGGTGICTGASTLLGPAAPPAAAACAAVGGAAWIFSEFFITTVNKAADSSRCLKLRHSRQAPTATPWFSTDSSNFCR